MKRDVRQAGKWHRKWNPKGTGNPDNVVLPGRDKQIDMIISIAKHQFGWRRKTIFTKIVEYVPSLKLTWLYEEAKRGYSTSKLFSLMTTAEKSVVIKRLLMIQKKNQAALDEELPVPETCAQRERRREFKESISAGGDKRVTEMLTHFLLPEKYF